MRMEGGSCDRHVILSVGGLVDGSLAIDGDGGVSFSFLKIVNMHPL